ncbi:MAG: MerR family transcriptional regulator [Candidatus Omnitrophota bacterium]|nr:helix-turn-helix domain-containing protein [Candidatus Omnitrophota bacterium]
MTESNKSSEQARVISAKDIVAQYNITYQTVNHYTDFGLLPVVTKKGNVRFYDTDLIDKRLTQIEEFKREGYSLRLIRKKLIGI